MPFQLVTVTRIANKVVDRSFGLRERYLEELEQLDPPAKWLLVKEISRIAEEHTEKVAYAGLVQKEVIDSWTDDDYEEMGITKAQVETELNYSSVILPLAEIYTKTEQRKAKARGRLEVAWGRKWEEKLGRMMPHWPAEGFMRELAVFAERNRDINRAVCELQEKIVQRRAAKRTKKCPYLMARDLATPVLVEKRRLRRRKRTPASPEEPEEQEEQEEEPEEQEEQEEEPEEQEEEEEEQQPEKETGGGDPAQEEEDNQDEEEEDIDVEEQEDEQAGKQAEEVGKGKEKAVSGKGQAEELGKGKGKAVSGKAQAEEQGKGKEKVVGGKGPRPETGLRKRKADAITKDGSPKFGVSIQAINLDINQGIAELRTEARDEEEIEDVVRVREAIRGLLGNNEWVGNQVLERRVQMLLRAMMMEVVEIEDEEDDE